MLDEPRPSQRRPWPRYAFAVVLVLLVAAGAAWFALSARDGTLATATPTSTLTTGPTTSAIPAVSPTATTTTTASADEHVVATEEGDLSFRFEDGAIVVRRTHDGETVVLGRGIVPTEPGASSGDEVPAGTAAFVMVCPSPTEGDSHRYVFGTSEAGGALQYGGPPSLGHAAPDGTFLFAIAALTFDPEARIELRSNDGVVAGFLGRAFERAVTEGEPQPSGCWVS